MAASYKFPGEVIEATASAAITKGDIVAVGDLLGIATDSAASGDSIIVALSGVFSGCPSDGTAADQGAKAYYNATTGKVTKTATSATQIGYFFSAVVANDTTCTIKLLG